MASARAKSPVSDALAQHADALIELSLSARVLLFGSYVLKSGRTSPYFFNAGLLYTGEHLHALAQAYASLIASVPAFAQAEVLFGPAYKGISLAALTAAELFRTTGRSIGFAYNRSVTLCFLALRRRSKEAKAHGEVRRRCMGEHSG